MTSDEMYEVESLMETYNLPELPDATTDDDTTARQWQLVLFRFGYSAEVLADRVSHEDAVVYCEREDTHGDGWFVGFEPKPRG
jgi:hypothetical protein